MTPQDELRSLLERVTEMVLDNVDKHGWAIPVCVAHSPTGERFIFVADSDEADPTPYDPQACLRSITHQVRQFIEDGKLRAIALARNVNITVSSDDGPQDTAAVKVLLDHQGGGGSTAYLLYRQEDGKAVPYELFYQELAERFFAAPAQGASTETPS
jgi:hypothetical protein